MWFAKAPMPGDEFDVWCSGRPSGKATVLDVRLYTGRYPEFFTHIVRFTADNTRAGWMEITADVAEYRNRNQKVVDIV